MTKIIDAEWEELPISRCTIRQKQKYAVRLAVYVISPLFAMAAGKVIGLMVWGG